MCKSLATSRITSSSSKRNGRRWRRSEPGWFAWEPPADPLDDNCPIDLRYLNELAAGGYITPEEYKAKKQAILNSL